MTLRLNPSRRQVLLGTLGAAALTAAGSATAQATPALLTSADTESVDHLVIGSGYGGAVLAQRLTQAGHRVLMLEMGKDWSTPGKDGAIFTKLTKPDERSMWFRDRTAMPLSNFIGFPIDQNIPRGPGVLDRIDLGWMNVYAGRGVGGGSLVNGAMAVTPRREFIAERIPAVDVERFFSTYLPRARTGLAVREHNPTFLESSPYYQFARVSRASAKKAGYGVLDVPTVYDPEYLAKEAAGQAPRSATDGEVIYGNNHGKNDLTKTYLARARATGRLTIRTMTAATTLAPRAGGGWTVTTETIGADGKRTPAATIDTTKLYLAAGSVGTTELLLRSAAKGTLPDLPDAVGTGWGPNGNVMLGRANHAWDATGIKQSTIPVWGIDGWTGVAREKRVFAEIAPMPAGIETWLSLYLAITDNPRRGTFSFDGAKNTLTLDWSADHAAPGIAAVKGVFDKINQANGTVYRTDLFGTNSPFGADFSYHPLGGAIIGEATDKVGRLKGYRDLFVADGALVPGCVGVNPFVTITALAEIVAEEAVRTA